jgi:hypothetical protein
MRILQNFKKLYFRRFLKNHLSGQPLLPVSTAKNGHKVAIIFEATQFENRKSVEIFVEKLRAQGKYVSVLAYFRGKTQPSMPYKYFNSKQVDWKGIPSGFEVERFLNETYDVLYALYLGENSPLEYLSACTKAHFKIGAYSTDLARFNLMISLKKDNSLENFIHQATFYLAKTTPTTAPQNHELCVV